MSGERAITYDRTHDRTPPSQSPFVLAAVDGIVTAFARASGQIAWRFQLPSGIANQRHVTRIVADERRAVIASGSRLRRRRRLLLVAGHDGELFCADHPSGRLLWHQRLPTVATVRWIGATSSSTAPRSSSSTRRRSRAFALETGQFLWQQPLVEAHTTPNVHPPPASCGARGARQRRPGRRNEVSASFRSGGQRRRFARRRKSAHASPSRSTTKRRRPHQWAGSSCPLRR